MTGSVGASFRQRGATVRAFLAGCVRIDTRALAVFRIAVALLILADLALRARNFSYFYTETGVVPRALATEAAPVDVGSTTLSIYHLSTDPTVTTALFVVHGLIAVLLLVGYETRLATLLSFLFVVSLDLHNPLVLSYADTLFMWLLFWAIFLPLGERWSIDAVHATHEPKPAVSSVASALILGQMIVMYVVNGYHKVQSDLWRSGDAAVLILGLDDTTFLLGDVTRSVPTLLRYGGLVWFGMLLFAWMLIVLRGRPRILAVGAFAMVHVSFALTVRIGAFAYVAIAGLLLFLQSQFWDDCGTLARRIDIDRRLPVDRTTLEAYRTGLESSQPKLEAIASVVPHRRQLFSRETFGTLLRRRFSNETGMRPAAVALLSLIVVASLVAAGGVVTDAEPEQRVTDAATMVVDHQTEWSIFAPNPRTTDRYYVFAAETTAREQLDVYNDRPLTFDRPYDELQRQYGTYRERFYMSKLGSGEPAGLEDRLAEYVCREWAESNDDELTRLVMYRVDEAVTLETIDAPEDRDRTVVELHRYGCGENEAGDVGTPPTE
ncbi:HTTM domain-containing protein [Natrialbaceae archaeon A-CW3]